MYSTTISFVSFLPFCVYPLSNFLYFFFESFNLLQFYYPPYFLLTSKNVLGLVVVRSAILCSHGIRRTTLLRQTAKLFQTVRGLATIISSRAMCVCLSHIVKLRKPETRPKISRSFVIGIDDLTGTHHTKQNKAHFSTPISFEVFNEFYVRNPSTFGLSV